MAPKYNRKKPVQYQPNRNGSKKKQWLIIIGILAIVLIIIGAYAVGSTMNNSNPAPTPTPTSTPTPPPKPTPATNQTKVLLQTSKGNITIQLFDYKPITTVNFLNLVQQGKYDGTVFHRIMKDFMIQGGTVNENLTPIQDEIGTYNRNLPYTIAMAKGNAANTATSSFFINTVDNGNKVIDYDGTKFDAAYTAFGKVISGQDVVDKIEEVPVTQNPYMQNEYSLPTQTITIISATIIS